MLSKGLVPLAFPIVLSCCNKTQRSVCNSNTATLVNQPQAISKWHDICILKSFITISTHKYNTTWNLYCKIKSQTITPTRIDSKKRCPPQTTQQTPRSTRRATVRTNTVARNLPFTEFDNHSTWFIGISNGSPILQPLNRAHTVTSVFFTPI
jgi:hypothetical protein